MARVRSQGGGVEDDVELSCSSACTAVSQWLF